MLESLSESHFRNLEKMYHSAAINHSVPSRLCVSKGHAVVEMNVSRAYWHSAGGMHGSMYFKGLDDAAFFSANSMEMDALVMTAHFEIDLLRMVSTESVKAFGYFERKTERKLWARSELFDASGLLVARGTGLFVVSDIKLESAQGYAASSPCG